MFLYSSEKLVACRFEVVHFSFRKYVLREWAFRVCWGTWSFVFSLAINLMQNVQPKLLSPYDRMLHTAACFWLIVLLLTLFVRCSSERMFPLTRSVKCEQWVSVLTGGRRHHFTHCQLFPFCARRQDTRHNEDEVSRFPVDLYLIFARLWLHCSGLAGRVTIKLNQLCVTESVLVEKSYLGEDMFSPSRRHVWPSHSRPCVTCTFRFCMIYDELLPVLIHRP